MLRKLIEKSYNIIQWTKKWHFFHFMVIIPGLFTTYSIYYLGKFYLMEAKYPISLDDHWLNFFFTPLVYGFTSYTVFFIAIGVEAIIILIRLLARKNFCVHSNFLINNKFYNFIYCFFFYVLALTILEYLLASGLILMTNYTS